MVVGMKMVENSMGLMTECSESGVDLCNLCAMKSSSRTRGARIRYISKESKPGIRRGEG